MLRYAARAKGKTPKVLTAATRQEPVIDIPEGETGRKPCDTRPVRALIRRKSHGDFRTGQKEATADAVQ
ncbi:hypothetical protein HAALTHF_22860n [Vreelandella aquamarina]|nr:hypothetical protein HAALTHF_22860n [Halomonas axialensis]